MIRQRQRQTELIRTTTTIRLGSPPGETKVICEGGGEGRKEGRRDNNVGCCVQMYRAGSRDTQLPSPNSLSSLIILTHPAVIRKMMITLENGLFTNCLIIYDRMAPFDLRLCSSFINWMINPRLGLTFLVCLISLRVLRRDQFWLIIMAAVRTVADRLRPTRQLMRTRPPGAARPPEMKSAAGWK